MGFPTRTLAERTVERRAAARAPASEHPHLLLLDAARIDVCASRAAGEPRRAPAWIHARRWGFGRAAPATILALHETDPQVARTGGRDLSVLEIHHDGPRGERPAPNRALARCDADLAALRAAVFDLHGVVRAQPQRPSDRLLLVATGIAAAAALVALGAGVSHTAITDDPLRDELLLDLLEGELMHERMVDDVAPRIAAAVLIDPSGATRDWREAALARITTPIALLEEHGTAMASFGYAALRASHRLHAATASEEAIATLLTALAEQSAPAVFASAAAQPAAFELSSARQAPGEPGGAELD